MIDYQIRQVTESNPRI